MREQEFGELYLTIETPGYKKTYTLLVPIIKAKNMIRRLAQRAIIYGALNPN